MTIYRYFLLQDPFHGKEGVVGSSPTEGSCGSPVVARVLPEGGSA
jgi:hypothetical protein